MAGKLLKYLPRPTSFSIPNSNTKSSSSSSAGFFSGPIVSVVPKEARRARKTADVSDAYEAQEPTSPKVSCMGQVKKSSSKDKKKKQQQNKKLFQSFNGRRVDIDEGPKRVKAKKHQSFNERSVGEGEKIRSGIQAMFRRKARPGRPPTAPAAPEAAPPEVGRMRRYASGRETLADFDWRTVAAGSSEEEEEEEEKGRIAHSGPILMGGGVVALERRKEVNLWKRRTLSPPVPLQVL